MGNVGQSSVNLAYDASGNMIEQSAGSPLQYTQIVYAPDGTKLALMNGTSTLVKAFVPLTGGATAVYQTVSGSVQLAYYRHSDWLGSSRLSSSSATPTQVTSDQAYAPFGETYAQSGTADPSFTGMDSDTVPNVYDFPAREYGALPGRWPSPDPLGVGAVDPTDPQSWNRYAYVRNSPLTLTDPNGMDYQVCVGGSYGYGDSSAPGDCWQEGGSSVTDLDLELGPCMFAVGNNTSGDIDGTGCEGYEGAVVGLYTYEGDGSGGGGGGGSDGGNGGGGGGGNGGSGNGENPNGGGPINYWPEGGPKINPGLAGLILPANCAQDPTCGTVISDFTEGVTHALDCVGLAQSAINKALIQDAKKGVKTEFKSTAAGAASGAVIGCIFTSEVGCIEGAGGGAVVGGLGGLLEGTFRAEYDLIKSLRAQFKQLDADLAACSGGEF